MEGKRERLLQMFIKVICGTLQVAVWMELWALPNNTENLFLFIFRGWGQNCGHVQFGPPWVRAVWQQHRVALSEAEVVHWPSLPSKSRLRRRDLHPGVKHFAVSLQQPANIRLLLVPFYLLPLSFARDTSHHFPSLLPSLPFFSLLCFWKCHLPWFLEFAWNLAIMPWVDLFLLFISSRFQPSHWLMRQQRVTSWSASQGTPKQTSWSTNASLAWPTDR